MPSRPPGLLPEVWTPNHAVNDAQLEWLLCLASSFQACQRAADKVDVAVRTEATRNRSTLTDTKSG